MTGKTTKSNLHDIANAADYLTMTGSTVPPRPA